MRNAQHLTLRLLTTPEQVQLIIADDGRGFEPSQIPRGRYGLIGLNERVKLLGGHFHVRSNPGAGTRLEIAVPLA